MKIALHFNADHESLGSLYGYTIYEEIFKVILENRTLNISSKLFVGDLLFLLYSQEEVQKKVEENVTSTTYQVNPEKYYQLIESWLYSEENNWKKFDSKRLENSLNHNIFAVCFESLDLKWAEYLFENLKDYEPFIGAMEINDSNKTHWMLYSRTLIPYARIRNKKLNLFHDSFESDDLDTEMQKEYLKIGFESVEFEDLKLKYSIFDSFHDYEHARRVAEWKKGFGSSLAYIADNVVSQLSDIAPDLGNKLWSALNTYESSETNEQFAQVVTTCRRIFEYVTDCIFPPQNELNGNGNSLKADKYKNRIYEYSKQNKLSSTNIDLITASTELLFAQWSKLNNLANKGVHAEVYRDETRRCLIRTVLMLDDIISLKDGSFEIQPNINLS
ncbi:hypothetical protein [Chryseobacterium nepalense]|uniref:Uncharacterized protein n=1 Tax=Chryseobacterium nepalense TaxID=1854498 RepID=A0ABY4K7T0_9FLAO|nr:hypothetical protein [Chryseobacterium nepalense]UPQ76832.1 hypothetical protein M0D58_04600 [Chryseobacterium nepalense]